MKNLISFTQFRMNESKNGGQVPTELISLVGEVKARELNSIFVEFLNSPDTFKFDDVIYSREVDEEIVGYFSEPEDMFPLVYSVENMKELFNGYDIVGKGIMNILYETHIGKLSPNEKERPLYPYMYHGGWADHSPDKYWDSQPDMQIKDYQKVSLVSRPSKEWVKFFSGLKVFEKNGKEFYFKTINGKNELQFVLDTTKTPVVFYYYDENVDEDTVESLVEETKRVFGMTIGGFDAYDVFYDVDEMPEVLSYFKLKTVF